MRLLHTALWLVVSISPAPAQRAPVIVIPGRPDVPVLINGVDVSWSVIEGEFGLDRPNEVNPTLIYRPYGRIGYRRYGRTAAAAAIAIAIAIPYRERAYYHRSYPRYAGPVGPYRAYPRYSHRPVSPRY